MKTKLMALAMLVPTTISFQTSAIITKRVGPENSFIIYKDTEEKVSASWKRAGNLNEYHAWRDRSEVEPNTGLLVDFIDHAENPVALYQELENKYKQQEENNNQTN